MSGKSHCWAAAVRLVQYTRIERIREVSLVPCDSFVTDPVCKAAGRHARRHTEEDTVSASSHRVHEASAAWQRTTCTNRTISGTMSASLENEMMA